MLYKRWIPKLNFFGKAASSVNTSTINNKCGNKKMYGGGNKKQGLPGCCGTNNKKNIA